MANQKLLRALPKLTWRVVLGGIRGKALSPNNLEKLAKSNLVAVNSFRISARI
jgi:hypothetical protein